MVLSNLKGHPYNEVNYMKPDLRQLNIVTGR